MIPNKRCCVLFYFLYFMSDFRFLKYTWNEFFQLSSTVWFSITSVNWPDCEFDACWSFSIFLADRTVKMKSSNFYLKKLFFLRVWNVAFLSASNWACAEWGHFLIGRIQGVTSEEVVFFVFYYNTFICS